MLFKLLFNWLNDLNSKPFRDFRCELEAKYATCSIFNFYNDSWNARDEQGHNILQIMTKNLIYLFS